MAKKIRFQRSFTEILKLFGKLTYFTTMRFGVDPDSQTAKIEELFYNEKVSENDFK